MNQLENYLLGKEAEATGTDLMPISPPPSKKNESSSPTKTIPKVGEVLEQGAGQAGEQYEKAPQAKALKPHVDISGKEPPKVVTKKEAQYYALPSHRRYPLDDYGSVKQASAYFEDWSKLIDPRHRREFCSNLVKRAAMLGIPVSDEVAKYGSETYAPDSEVSIALDGRRALLTKQAHVDTLDAIKVARHVTQPEIFAEMLGEFDRMVGIDQCYGADIPDPYFSTFGIKTAGEQKTVSKKPEGSMLVGGVELLSRSDLTNFAKARFRTLASVFGDDFAREFQKDPEGIFNSLPLDQKKMVTRMATDNSYREPTST